MTHRPSLSAIADRAVVVAAADGRPLVRLKALHAAAVAVTATIVAPRMTAAAAIGALFGGYSLNVEDTSPPLA
ncbi:MAG: hypothetical protein R3290_11955 [Acidimicrobiia bacterium]|nr:hypothetical protein [Acidimicrobiia bacterium]